MGGSFQCIQKPERRLERRQDKIFTEISSDKSGGKGHKLSHRILPLNLRKPFFPVRVTEPHRGCLREVEKPSGSAPGQLNPGGLS